jgi:hypothetical protein
VIALYACCLFIVTRMPDSLDQNRIAIAIAVLIVVLSGAWYLHSRDSHGPFYEVTTPWIAEDQKQITGMCEITSISVQLDERDFCRCVLEHIESQTTGDTYRAAIADAKSKGQMTDPYTQSAFLDCQRRLGIKPLGS